MKVLFPLVALLIFALTAVACAAAAPTATPIPTAALQLTPTSTPLPTATPTPAPTATPQPTSAPTATPLPTATPEPTPTATPAPTATPHPTATPEPSATPEPTPTPTATPQPTDTPVPTVPWKKFSPKPYFSVDLPEDWEAESTRSIVSFNAPWHRATLTVFSGTRGERMDKDLTLADFADGFLGIWKKEPGFELDSFYEVSPTIQRSRYRFSREIGYCDDQESYGLYIFQSVRVFVIAMDVCADWTDQYGDAFVERVFDSLIYTNQLR